MRYFHSCNSKEFDWTEFNARGRQLHKELQEIVKLDYMLVYGKSFEEKEAIK